MDCKIPKIRFTAKVMERRFQIWLNCCILALSKCSKQDMSLDYIKGRDFTNEFKFNTSRSSGPGGQNVNKVNSKVELRFHITDSVLLNEFEMKLLFEKYATKITEDGELLIVSQKERSQLMNKEIVIEKFYDMLNKAFTPRKPRKATKPSRASKEKRLEKKRITSLKKESRKTFGI